MHRVLEQGFAGGEVKPCHHKVAWVIRQLESGNRVDEMKRIIQEPEVQNRINGIGLIPFDSPPIEGIQRYILSEADKWGGIVRKLGLQGSQ